MPACLQAVAACAMMVTDSQKLVLSHSLVLHASHQVQTILNNLASQHMTLQRRRGYEAILLSTIGLTIITSTTSNPAALLQALLHSNPADRTHTPEHDCWQEINNTSSARPDLESTPFNTGRHIYVDGSCSKPADDVYLCGYAVCELPNTVHKAFSLPYMSAQAAE